MKTLVTLVAGIIYILLLFCLIFVVFAPMFGFEFGIWGSRSGSDIGYAKEIPTHFRVIV